MFINYFLREIIIRMIKKIGFHTETSQTNVIMIFVFIVQFLNTGVLVTLINANTNEAGLKLGIFNGAYPDFDYNWYSDVGATIIYALVFTAVWPFIEISVYGGLSYLYRFIDKGFSFKKYKTNCKTIQQYINLYSGPEYLIHYKYSSMLNIVFVTFMYGVALPVLFPVGLACFIISYFVEKILLVYYYREPPSYDSKLNNTAISILLWAPFFMFSVGYWFMSNKQIFDNFAILNEKANPVVYSTGHVLFREITDGTSLSYFIMAIIFFICLVFKSCVVKIYEKSPLAIKFKDKYDEKLPKYHEALEYDDSMYLMTLERHVRKAFGFKTLLDYTLKKVVEAKASPKKIYGVGVYDMLANIRY